MLFNTSRIKALWPWLVEARYAWLSIIVIFIALVISLRPHTSEPVIRITGLILQLLGICTVIWGISETRELFGHPSFVTKVKSWLSRFPLIRRDISLSASCASFASLFGKARGHVTHGAGENPTIETRVDALEKNIASIHERITQTQKEIDEELQKATDALKAEGQARQFEDNAILQKLEATGTGGVHISAIGASWLFMGVILSTAAIEISELLK